MSQSPNSDPKLSPELREKLFKESKRPLSSLRKVLWVILFGSAGIGLFIMSLRSLSGELVQLSDIGIQVGAFLVFGGLLWFDR